MSVMDEIPGYLMAVLQLTIAGCAIFFVRSTLRTVKEALFHIGQATATLETLPPAVAPALWPPVCVAVVGSLFQIKPAETVNEYKKQEDAKKWIVNNTFPDNELTTRFMDTSRFMKSGYDFKTAMPSGDGGPVPLASEKKTSEPKIAVAKASGSKVSGKSNKI